MSTDTWRKSSYSGNTANCVHVALDSGGRPKIRESDGPNATLVASPAAFRAFIRTVKTGEFDRLAAD
ncbi:DUF397 domain-containing protein [Streptomyces sp. NPDC000941]